MRKTTPHLLLFISAILGAAFSFYFLINRPINALQLTDIEKYALRINHGLFFVSLFLMFFVFFMNKKIYSILGISLVIVGLLYLSLMFSFIEANYYYLVPLGFYVISGFLILGQNKYKT